MWQCGGAVDTRDFVLYRGERMRWMGKGCNVCGMGNTVKFYGDAATDEEVKSSSRKSA